MSRRAQAAMTLTLVCAWAPAILADADTTEREAVTFSRDVAPLVYRHCAACHRSAGVAPFTLLRYRDVKRHAEQIAKVTQSGYMPPWLPDDGFGEFKGRRGLTPEEIALLTKWVDAGAPEGDPSEAPEPPAFVEGWQLGQPDLIVTMEPYALAATGRNVFRNFVIPIPEQPTTRFVRAVEFRPGNPAVVHHAVMRVDRTGQCRKNDERDPEPGFGGMDMANSQPPDGLFLGWTPGASPFAGHEGIAWRLTPGTDAVLQLHMVPSGKPETVQPSIGLYFTDTAPTRDAFALVLQSFDIDIPAGRNDYVVEQRFPLAVPVEVLSIYPHAHFLAKDMKVFATLPDGTTRWLLSIDDWDFNWQDSFSYVAPVLLPKGSVITMRYTYDNTAANPRNPHIPPQRVRFGLESSDEMASVTLQLVTATPGDLAILNESVWRNLLEKNPKDTFALYNLGTALCTHGKLDEGIGHLTQAVALQPDYPGASYNLGLAHKMNGATDEAAKWFTAALAVNPNDAAAHSELGGLLTSKGRPVEAIEHLTASLKLRPNLAETHQYFGDALVATGRPGEAVPHYSEAARLKPDWPTPLASLAWTLAVSPDETVRDAERAITAGEKAAELTRFRQPAVLDALAAAYASAGRFDDAVRTAEDALALATAAGSERLAGDLRKRLASYRRAKSPR